MKIDYMLPDRLSGDDGPVYLHSSGSRAWTSAEEWAEYDDENAHTKRTDEEIENMFNNIINQDSWIIEDGGRDRFDKGLECCDKIYYLKIPKFIVYKRVIKRWFKQKLGKEKYNYPPTFYQFYDMLRIAKLYFKHEKDKLKKISKYEYKLKYLSNKDLDSI